MRGISVFTETQPSKKDILYLFALKGQEYVSTVPGLYKIVQIIVEEVNTVQSIYNQEMVK